MKDISAIANSYIGQIELPDKTGFQDPAFDYLMKSVGWRSPLNWCGYFAKLVWLQAYADHEYISRNIDLLFKETTRKTFDAIEESELFETSLLPSPGAIGFYVYQGIPGKEGKGTSLLVTAVEKVFFKTVEIHSQDGCLATMESRRKINKPYLRTGLNLIGFVHPILFP